MPHGKLLLQRLRGGVVRSILMMMAVAVSAGILSACGGPIIARQLDVHRGQPVSAVIAKYGNPTERNVIEGNEVYFWSDVRFVNGRRYSCRIWTTLDKQDIVTNWGYESCAF